MDWKFFFLDMEKRAMGIAPMAFGVMNVLDFKSQLGEAKKKSKLDQPLPKDPQYKVGSPYQRQFDIGKNISESPNVIPRDTLY